jgi:ATP-dependent DNA helicase RecG
MYPDRIEIRNPGGIYGRLRVDQLGKMQPDTRNPVLVTALEVMGLTENRYSGIPTIRRSMKDFNLEDPVFADERGTFTVILYNRDSIRDNTSQRKMTEKEEELLNFLKIPRSRNEIAEYLGIGTIAYVMQTYINPLVEKGLVRLTIPEKPKSPKQRFVRK